MPETVVITGAAAGVGRATARAFGRRGARLGLLARGVDDLNDAAAEIEAASGAALVLPTDVADADAVEAAAEAVERRFGPIDIWIWRTGASISAFVQICEWQVMQVSVAGIPALDETSTAVWQ